MRAGASQVLFLVGAAVLLSFPALRDGLPPGHDAEDHIEYQRHFTRQFWSGDLYPRWLSEANAGLGSPAFFLQYPAPYFAAALVGPIIPRRAAETAEERALGLVVAASLAASGLTAWLWLRTRVRGWPAALGAAVYMAAPYHLCVDLYERAALGELASFVWLPLLALGAQRIAESRRGAVIGFAAAHAALLTTNAFASILALPMIGAWTAVAAPRGRRAAALARFAAGLVLSAGLAAIYLAPLFAHRPLFRFDVLRVPGSGWDYREGFLTVTPRLLARAGPAGEALGPALGALGILGDADPKSDAFLAKLLASAVSAAAAGVILFLVARRGSGPNTGLGLLALAALLVSFALQFRASDFVWSHLPILRVVQFPWREQVPLTLALAILAALAAERLAWGHRPRIAAAALVAGLAALVAGNAAVWDTARFAERRPPASTEPDPDPIVGAYARSKPPLRVVERWDEIGTIPFFECVPAGAGARARRVGPREIEVDLAAAGATVGGTPRRATVKQLDYPAWRCEDAETGARIRHASTDPWGLVTFSVPPGARTIRVRLATTRSETAGAAISAVCWLGVLAALAGRRVSGPTGLPGSPGPDRGRSA